MRFKNYFFSIVIHFCLFLALIFGFKEVNYQPVSNKSAEKKEAVSANLIDQSKIEEAIQRQTLKAKKEKEDKQKAENLIAKQKKDTKIAKQKAIQELEKARKENKKAKEEMKKAQEAIKQAEEMKKKVKEMEIAANKMKEKLAKQEKENKKTKNDLTEKEKEAERKKRLVDQKLEEFNQKQQKQKQAYLDNEIQRYVANMISKIEGKRQKFKLLPKDLVANVSFKIRRDGSIYNVKLTDKSGVTAYDEHAIKAVMKASPFNMPKDEEVLDKFMIQFSEGFTSGIKNDYEVF